MDEKRWTINPQSGGQPAIPQPMVPELTIADRTASDLVVIDPETAEQAVTPRLGADIARSGARDLAGDGGFMLNELLIWLLLAALLLGLSVPPVRASRDRSMLHGASEAVLSYVERARARAETSAEPLVIRFDVTRRVVELDGADPPDRLVLPPSVVLTNARFASVGGREESTLELRPDGSASPGRVTIRGGERECALVQALRGPMRLACS